MSKVSAVFKVSLSANVSLSVPMVSHLITIDPTTPSVFPQIGVIRSRSAFHQGNHHEKRIIVGALLSF